MVDLLEIWNNVRTGAAFSNPFQRKQREGGICLHSHSVWNENYSVASVESVGKQLSTGQLHWIVQIPLTDKNKTHPTGWVLFLWRRRRDLNPRYPFGVYTISNRARSASYATSPCVGFVASPLIIQHTFWFVNPYFHNFPKKFRHHPLFHFCVKICRIGVEKSV